MKKAFSILALAWVLFAGAFSVYIAYLEISGQHWKTLKICLWMDDNIKNK